MAIDATTNTFRIIIVGGGIAGLATVSSQNSSKINIPDIDTRYQAIAMRGPQREIIVLEKSRMNKEVGALLSLQPNAQKIVEQWNLKDILQRAKPTAERQFRILDTSGKIHMNIDMDGKKYGADRMVYHRQDLHSALREAALSTELPGYPASIVTAAKVVGCDCETGAITLADGTIYQGDLIIGADGIHSVIREAVLKAGNHELVHPAPTGVSAYRLLVETTDLAGLDVDKEVFDHTRQATTLIMGHDRRVIMGPARNGDLLGLVGMVPDEHMHESSNPNSWTTPGDLSKLLQTYNDFPQWIRDIFKQAPDIALWQLRDIDALPTWIAGRCIIIGDAAHAMLPTQGQGASQSIEDAEALQAFFADTTAKPNPQQITRRIRKVFEARYKRASLIQAYSRQQAKPATEKGSVKVTLNPAEFLDYNCKYEGAVKWLEQQEAS
ncbi:FAD/NAD(P)-binding domain-containing protein [Aureobasidium pullulans]|uniref:FAD/NAD(P)-binding domain-containing protein n=1 Tax=Aureobasidium pullulans TaxID=5580 RepID=A0A4S9D6W0_AURPU|nr:FAD/NAD(P)-binding domain-containing protein [Aureobasidium pullulans]